MHSQLLTVVAEHRWELNPSPPATRRCTSPCWPGCWATSASSRKKRTCTWARGIKFHRHPGAHLRKKPGRWIVCAELVETTRLFGRGIAHIDPQWLEEVGAHLLKKQLLDPHWEKKAAEVVAFERATLYGLVVYSGRRKPFDQVDPHAAREMFLRQALVAGDVLPDWGKRLPFLAANEKLIAKVEELEHKSRRQDVLVDEELIFAFYDQQVPQDVQRPQLRALVPRSGQGAARPAQTHARRACATRRRASPPVPSQDGALAAWTARPATCTNPATRAMASPSPFRCSCSTRCRRSAASGWCPACSRTRSRPCSKPAAAPAQPFCAAARQRHAPGGLLGTPDRVGHTGLVDALLKQVRDETSLDVKRADFKLDMVPPHLFMNFRVVDEHGRQLGQGEA